MNFFLVFSTLMFLALLQARLPSMAGLRLELLPAFVAYGALTFRPGKAFVLALVAGCVQDALSAAPFGITAVAYGVAALVLTGSRESLDREIPPLQVAAGAIVSGIAAIAAFFVVGFSFKIIPVVFVAGIITPLFFFAADYTRYMVRTS